MTSSKSETRLAYEEDRRFPYYSIQDGRRNRAGRQDRRKSSSRWIWGHFQEALRKALESRVANVV